MIENVRSANALRESVTRTVKVNVPAVVGVPVGALMVLKRELRAPYWEGTERAVH